MIAYEDFQASHLDEVMALCHAEGWSSYADRATALRAFSAAGCIVVVAIDAGVVGFVQLQTDRAVHAHVSNIVVTPSYRRRGVGRRLLEVAFERSGARYVDLVSVEGSDEFYRSFEHKEFPGFRLYPGRSRELP